MPHDSTHGKTAEIKKNHRNRPILLIFHCKIFNISTFAKHDSYFKAQNGNHAFYSCNQCMSESSELLNPSIFLISFPKILTISTFAKHDSSFKAQDENHAF